MPFQCSVPAILAFLQSLLEKGKTFSTLKVYLATISACHVGFGDWCFIKGACCLHPVSKLLAPSWDLPLALDALSGPPFEPLWEVDLKTLLLAIASAKWVSDIHTLSMHPTCTRFAPGDSRVTLKPNPQRLLIHPQQVYMCTLLDEHQHLGPCFRVFLLGTFVQVN